MPDPLEVLPFEIWTYCIQLVICDQSVGPLELTLVSQSWQTSLLSDPLLWTRIYFRNEEDETARIQTFLHLSGDCPLEVDITTVLPTTASLQLIKPYFSRINVISIRPSPIYPFTDIALYRRRWRHAVSCILATFSHEMGPSETKDIICVGFRPHAGFKHIVLAYPAVEWTSKDERSHESSTPLNTSSRWEGIIFRILKFVKEEVDPVVIINGMFYGDWNGPFSDKALQAANCLMINDIQIEDSSRNWFVPSSNDGNVAIPSEPHQVNPPCLHYLKDDLLYNEMRPSLVSKKRRGYRALVPLHPGTLLLRDRPLILHPTDGEDLQCAIAAMKPADRKQFYQLGVAPGLTNYGRDLGTFKTNAFRAGIAMYHGEGRARSGVFRLGSGFNHSCKPNVHQHWNESRMEMEFRTLRYIAPNEELCISYDILGLFRIKSNRGLRLNSWGINPCLCSACEHPNPLSDATRVWLGIIVNNPGAHTSSGIFPELSLLKKEGLYHYRDTLLFDGYLACREEGDLRNARLWLAQALDTATVCVGGEDPRVGQLRTTLSRLDEEIEATGIEAPSLDGDCNEEEADKEVSLGVCSAESQDRTDEEEKKSTSEST